MEETTGSKVLSHPQSPELHRKFSLRSFLNRTRTKKKAVNIRNKKRSLNTNTINQNKYYK